MKMYDLSMEINPEKEITITQYTSGDSISIYITKEMAPAVIEALTAFLAEL